MATFPELMPLRREWGFPKFPTIDFEGVGGSIISFEFGETPSDQPLTLVYELLSEAEMQLIRDHYLGQQSVHPFTLPPICYAGYQLGESIFDPTTTYLYAEEPEEEIVNFDLYNTDVSLRSVLP